MKREKRIRRRDRRLFIDRPAIDWMATVALQFFILTLPLAVQLQASDEKNGPQNAPAAAKSDAQQPAAGQQQEPEKLQAPNVTVIVTAPRMEIPLQENPAATTVVAREVLELMPKKIGAEEAFKLVPGVKVDNQANGERVHLSIRGQGLLTERGIRGIKVLLDGLPLNDPTGFVPDLFDVDWSTVESIEVFRGPASALYGGGAAGGVISIQTRDGDTKPIDGQAAAGFGSYGFWKYLGEAGGTTGILNYRISASGTGGDGYRDHTRYHGTNLYGKLNWSFSKKFRLTTIIAGTGYFNENAEGLNIDQVRENRRMANPDALTYNEYQRTRRVTVGATGQYQLTSNQDLSFSAYYRNTLYQESVPSSVQHRGLDTPGAIVQYALHMGQGWLKNHITLGIDMDWQRIGEYRRANLGLAVEGPELLSDEEIRQDGIGVYFLDRLELGPKWTAMFDVRNDHFGNSLLDDLKLDGVDLSGEMNFSKTTGRLGLAWNPRARLGMYASWGQGFLPPATEELANNPDGLGGFNQHLVPATSTQEEVGARGSLGRRVFYDAAFFHLDTDNDFGRYRIPSRPLETFYQNAGSSRRYGLETSVNWYPVEQLMLRAAYTFSDFKYLDINTLQGHFTDVYMPNAPRHQAYFDLEYRPIQKVFLGLGVESMSRAYVDATNLTWANGYTIYHPRVGYRWSTDRMHGEISLLVRNLFGKEYIAFTEPDPDGNSYQPAPTREFFVSARFFLGR